MKMDEITERMSVDREETVMTDRALGCSNMKSTIHNSYTLLEPTIKLKGQILSFMIFKWSHYQFRNWYINLILQFMNYNLGCFHFLTRQ